jgi:hypothetical protein
MLFSFGFTIAGFQYKILLLSTSFVILDDIRTMLLSQFLIPFLIEVFNPRKFWFPIFRPLPTHIVQQSNYYYQFLYMT